MIPPFRTPGNASYLGCDFHSATTSPFFAKLRMRKPSGFAGPQPQQEFSGAYFSCSDCSMLTLSMLGLWRPRIFPELRPHVKRSRPDETIVVVLLSYVRTPSGNARRGKERCVQFRLKPEHEEHRRC